MSPTSPHIDTKSQESTRSVETCLTNRTSVPEDRAALMRTWSASELEINTRTVGQIIKRFAQAVADAVENPRTTDDFVRALDLKSISRDHEWRTIFSVLKGCDEEYKNDRAVAIRQYLQYLCSRKELLDFICASRQQLEETNEHETVLAYSQDAVDKRPTLTRLGKNTRILVAIPYRGELALSLGRHPFTLLDGYPPRLIEPSGRELDLRKGRLSIGRHPSNDLVIDRNLNEVSRGHLILEWLGDSRIFITDLSSRGTFVENE